MTKFGCPECRDYAEQHMNVLQAMTNHVPYMTAYHDSGHNPDFNKPVEEKKPEWAIQQVSEEGAPFLLYKGVLVGRLYGGCPYREMLEKLNG
jgi:hypothetical protein